jgi:hypothetical protein
MSGTITNATAEEILSSGEINPKWQARLDEMVSWVSANGRFPQRTKEDEKENLLAVWRMNQRVSNPTTEGGRATRDLQHKVLDELLPNWRGEKRRAYRTWDEGAASFVVWVTQHGYYPSHVRADDAEESRQHFWMVNMRQAENGIGTYTWHPEYGDFLDEFVPEWRGGGNRKPADRSPASMNAFQDAVSAIVEFIDQHKRYPHSKGSTEFVISEKIRRFRHKAVKGTLPQSKLDILDAAIPGWRDYKTDLSNFSAA